jgi:hypothetical protein
MQCVAHPSTLAARQCSRCQRAWCPLCIKQLAVAGQLLEVCVKCNAPLVAPSAIVERPDHGAVELARRALTVEGLVTAAGLALPLLLSGAVSWIPGMDWFTLLMSVIYYGSLVGYYFQIIAHVGEGRSGLPGPSDLLDDLWSLATMSLRGCLCLFVAAVPYAASLALLPSPPSLPATLLLLALGLVYLPAALVSVVLTDSTLGALYPVAWLQVISRAPASYVRLVALFWATLIAFALFGRLVAPALQGVPLAGAFLGAWAANLLWFAQACLVGGFLRRHASDFGYA